MDASAIALFRTRKICCCWRCIIVVASSAWLVHPVWSFAPSSEELVIGFSYTFLLRLGLFFGRHCDVGLLY